MFEIRGKAFFITYPRCNLELETLRDRLSDKFVEQNRTIHSYIIADEEHKDGGRHRHVYLKLDSELRAKVRANWWDIEGFHPNVENVRSHTKVLKYCTKEGKFISDGMKLEKSMDKEKIAKELIEGKDLVEIVKKYPKYLFGYTRIKLDLQMFMLDSARVEPLARCCGIWLAGPSGSGKSAIATERMGTYYFKGNNKWWDGYNNQETVVCEDVDSSWKEVLPYFKIWADKYPFNGETKGGTISLRPKRVVVTSNRTLEEYLEELKWPTNDYVPYIRRFNQHWITSIDDWDDQL